MVYLPSSRLKESYLLAAMGTEVNFLGAASPKRYATDTEHSIPLSHIVLALNTTVLPACPLLLDVRLEARSLPFFSFRYNPNKIPTPASPGGIWAFRRKKLKNKMVTIILWIVNLTSGYCPDELLHEVFSCLNNLTHGSDLLFPSADVELMKQHCETGGFRDSVECLEKVYSQCSSPKDMERLRKYAAPAAWQSGFQRFCDNIDEYTRRKSCVEHQNRALGTCIEGNMEPVTPESEEEVSVMSLEEREDKSTERVCTLFYWMNHCVNKPSKCGPEVGAILSDFVGGMTPPICRDFSLPSSSSNIYNNNLMIISSLLLTFFLINIYFTSIF